MDESIVYLLTEQVSETELRGRYDDATRHGELWMVRSSERRGQKVDKQREAEKRAKRDADLLERLEQSSD